MCVCVQHFFALENVELDYFESVAQPGNSKGYQGTHPNISESHSEIST